MHITYQELNYNSPDEILLAAKIHESAPLNWDFEWKVTDAGISQWVKRINEFKDSNKMFLLFAKLSNGEVVGFHWLRLYEKDNENLVNIDSLWVSDKLRKNGIGSELKRRGESWAKSMGATTITTNVFYSNKNMIDFNLKLGFKAEAVKMSKKI
ncbi:MAG: GNAT family N-acetyltransferase [Bacteriovorax sp.]